MSLLRVVYHINEHVFSNKKSSNKYLLPCKTETHEFWNKFWNSHLVRNPVGDNLLRPNTDVGEGARQFYSLIKL